MPSATDVGLCQTLLDGVLQARPDLTTAVTAILDRIGAQSPASFVESLAADDVPSFTLLMQVVAGAYTMHARVRAAIGYTGQVAVPLPNLPYRNIAFEQHTSRDRIRYRSV